MSKYTFFPTCKKVERKREREREKNVTREVF